MDMIIKETNIWGNNSNVKNTNKYIRLMKKQQILQCYPFVDHYKIYVYKPKTQKGPAKEEQTFIVSYPYNYDSYANETEFIDKLNELLKNIEIISYKLCKNNINQNFLRKNKEIDHKSREKTPMLCIAGE
jgi:hypothetical protein